MSGLRNWAGNIEFAGPLHRPSSLPELQRLVTELPNLRALGTGHSFNRIADGPALVSVAGLPRRLELRPDGTVLAAAGLRYAEIAAFLHAHGRALHNLGSLPHISLAGACSTGTHGSGVALRCLAAAVREVELATADGMVRLIRADDPDFGGSVLALGALGVITALVLETEPTYDVRQSVYEAIPIEAVIDAPDAFLAGAYSVSLFTDWQLASAWVKRRDQDGPAAASYLGFPVADGPRHPIATLSPVPCTVQGGQAGPWHERLPHFRVEYTPSSGAELQSEYFVASELAPAALRAVAALRAQLAPVLQISEIRAVAADELWISPAYERDSVAVHFTWTDDEPAVRAAVRVVEQVLQPLEPRPHWGKIFTLPARDVTAAYPRWGDFVALARRLDPVGTFGNGYLANLGVR